MSTAEKELESTLHKAHELGIYDEVHSLARQLRVDDVKLRYDAAIEIAFNKLTR